MQCCFFSVDPTVGSEPELRQEAAGAPAHPTTQQERPRRREEEERSVRHLHATGRLQGDAHPLHRRPILHHQEGTKNVFTELCSHRVVFTQSCVHTELCSHRVVFTQSCVHTR